MGNLNLNALVSKLLAECKLTLESAAVFCLERMHYDIEIEHWLKILVNDEKSYFAILLAQNNCDTATIYNGIDKRLEKLKKGNEQTPTISHRVIDWLNEAWSIGSLDYQLSTIDSGLLLIALIREPILNQIAVNISNEFDKLSAEILQQQYFQLVKSQTNNSTKQTVTTTNSTALDEFAIDLIEQAKSGKLDPAICREDEIHQMMQILSRRRQNNAILVGEPGVGKTAIVEGLALRIANNDVPELLKDVRIYSLDLGLLQAGASIKGEYEKRLKNVIKDIKNSPFPIIVFIDEAHTLIGSGAQSGQNDAANLLKPALARGELHCIAATTWREYKQYFENDAALTRRFQVVSVDEPDNQAATFMLRSLAASFERHHKVFILDEAIQQAVVLSDRYISDRFLPDKAISVLDTACARIASQQTSFAGPIEKRRREIAQLTLEKQQLEKEITYGVAHCERLNELNTRIERETNDLQQLTEQWEYEKAFIQETLSLVGEVSDENTALIRQKLSEYQDESHFIHPFVDIATVAQVIADWSGIPVGNMLKSQAQRILDLQEELTAKIIGQDQALIEVTAAMKTAGAKLMDPSKPLGVFLFAGPSGVGKTETALVLAESLFGDRKKIITLNMTEFKEEHKVALLTGAPPGYIGYGEGGKLTEAVRRDPYSIILLDEMEKAHPSVQDIFYQVFDKGMMQDSQGRIVNFKNTLIIMTANSASELIIDYALTDKGFLNDEKFQEEMQNELLKTFKPAFLGRIKVIPFSLLDETAVAKIASMKLKTIANRLYQQHHIKLEITAQASDAIVQQSLNHLIGGRQIDALLNQFILPKLSAYVLTQIIADEKIESIYVDYTKETGWLFETSH